MPKQERIKIIDQLITNQQIKKILISGTLHEPGVLIVRVRHSKRRHVKALWLCSCSEWWTCAYCLLFLQHFTFVLCISLLVLHYVTNI